MAPLSVHDFQALAQRCQAPVGDRAKARDLLDLFGQMDWDAQTALLVGNAQSIADADLERLRTAGWRLEEHPEFTGRGFVFEAFEEFVRSCQGRGGVFLVRASAGMGKTALLTEWIRRTGRDRAGFYFRYRDGRVLAAAMAEALWQQLGQRYDLPAADVPPAHELTARMEERLRQIAQTKLAESERLLLFVDALDEADDPGGAVRLIPKHLPPQVFLIVTSRPSAQGNDHLAGLVAAGARVFALDEHRAENHRDLMEYLRLTLGEAGRDGWAERLAEATAGSFMLATLFAEAVRQGSTTPEVLLRQAMSWEDLPAGQRLLAYYQESWERACRLVDEEHLANFAGVLAAAENWISERIVFDLLVWQDERQRRGRTWTARSFKQTVAALGWLLLQRTWEQAGYAADFLQVRHQSGRDFLLLGLRHHSVRDFLVGMAGPVGFELPQVHALLGEFYLERAQRDGWRRIDPYGRFYAVRHLLQSGRSDLVRSACDVLRSPDYLLATLGEEPASH